MNTPCRHIPKVNINDLAMDFIVGIFGSALPIVLYGEDILNIYGYKPVFIAGFFITIGFWVIIIDLGNRLSVLSSLSEFIAGMDPNEIFSRCEFLNEKNMSENEKLEKAYLLATQRAYALFVNFFIYWIIFGVANAALIYFAPPHWLTTISIYTFSLFGFISFILWIISYLRYRDYTKQLLAIQLKKSDKAEIAIKI